MASKSLTFDIFGRDRTASKTMKGIGDNADSLGRRFQGVAKGIGIAAAAGIAALSVAAIGFATESVKAFAEAETQQRKLEDAFERFPALASTNIDAIRKMNEALAKKTRFDDDAIAVGQAQLAQYGLTGDQLKDMTPLLLDYAARTGKDVAGAAEDLGKALLGQGRALKDVGIDFQDTGSVAGNFAQLMQGLGTQVSGFAEKDALTAAGQLENLQNRFGELQEKIGEALMPALQGLMDTFELEVMPVLEDFADWFVTDGLPAIQGFVAWISENGDWAGPLVGGIALVTAAIWLLNAALLANPIVLAIAGIVAGLTWLAGTAVWVSTDFAGATGTVTSAAQFMVDALGNGWNQITTWFGQLIGAFANGWGQITGAFSNGASQISGFVAGIGANIASFVGTVIGTLTSLPGRIAGIFVGAGAWLLSAGRNIVMGLVTGIGSAIGSAVAAAANVAKQVADAAKSALGIKSPSRVFREIGVNVGLGFIGGLESQMRPVSASVEALVRTPAMAGGGTMPVSGGAVTNNFYYTAQPIRDNDPLTTATMLGREFGRRVAG